MTSADTTSGLMRSVILACLPGLACLTWFFGWGHLLNLIWIGLLAVGFEAIGCWLRRSPIRQNLSNHTALVTGVLLALALPPSLPWWASATGIGFAILVGKHLFGGTGANPFNPAMLGYAVLVVSFPLEMTSWLAPRGVVPQPAELLPTLEAIFFPRTGAIDAWTMATPLDIFKFREGLSQAEVWTVENGFGRFAGIGWEWVNLAFLAGGLWLMYRKVISWHAPVGMIAAIALLAVIFFDYGSSESSGSPLLHLLSGGTMLTAFFIITDPVSGPARRQGQLIFGLGAGVLAFVIRAFGSYADALAFAVLMMNMAVPVIDLYRTPARKRLS